MLKKEEVIFYEKNNAGIGIVKINCIFALPFFRGSMYL